MPGGECYGERNPRMFFQVKVLVLATTQINPTGLRIKFSGQPLAYFFQKILHTILGLENKIIKSFGCTNSSVFNLPVSNSSCLPPAYVVYRRIVGQLIFPVGFESPELQCCRNSNLARDQLYSILENWGALQILKKWILTAIKSSILQDAGDTVSFSIWRLNYAHAKRSS